MVLDQASKLKYHHQNVRCTCQHRYMQAHNLRSFVHIQLVLDYTYHLHIEGMLNDCKTSDFFFSNIHIRQRFLVYVPNLNVNFSGQSICRTNRDLKHDNKSILTHYTELYQWNKLKFIGNMKNTTHVRKSPYVYSPQYGYWK